MCYKYANILNPQKNNQLEKYLIFTIIFQMNMLKKCKQIHIDGIFKSCPRSFYQILNITAFYEQINSNIPIFMIPLTGKSEYLYNKVFEDVINLLSENEMDIDELLKYIMCDF